MMNFGMLQEVKNDSFWELEQNKNEFEMGKSSSNVLNVFKSLSLTGHCVHVYLESNTLFYYIF